MFAVELPYSDVLYAAAVCVINDFSSSAWVQYCAIHASWRRVMSIA